MDNEARGTVRRATLGPMGTVVTRKQALARGISLGAQRHRLESGQWQRVFDGVYVTHSGAVTWRERATAAVLARGDGAVVTLDGALHLWQLRPGRDHHLGEPASCHRRRRLPAVRTRRRRRLAVATRYGIPVTSVEQTVLDVIALPRTTVDDAIALITRAVAQRRTTLGALREELSHHPAHPWRRILEEYLDVALEGLESVAEVRYVRDVEQAHELPTMRRQVLVGTPSEIVDGRSRRLDLKDLERGLGLEIDGELFHRDRQLSDRTADRWAAGQGEVTLRAGWVEVVSRPCELAADVAAAQRARGWTGTPTACGPDVHAAPPTRASGPRAERDRTVACPRCEHSVSPVGMGGRGGTGLT